MDPPAVEFSSRSRSRSNAPAPAQVAAVTVERSLRRRLVGQSDNGFFPLLPTARTTKALVCTLVILLVGLQHFHSSKGLSSFLSNNAAAAVKRVGSKEEGGVLITEVPQVVDTTSVPSWNISTIIPVCNKLHSLQDAIESALQQTYPVFEVIVSIDSGPDCVNSIKNIWEKNKDDNRVRVFKLPPCPQNPCGVGRNRNYAIEQASPSASHFALLDDDDVWYPRKTEIQVKAMQEGNYSYASSDATLPKKKRCRHGSTNYTSHDLEKGKFFLANGGYHKKIISKRLHIPLDAKLPSHVTHAVLSAHNIFVASASIFSKDLFHATTSGFDEGIDRKEDFKLWLEFTKICPGLFITDPLVVYDNTRNVCDIMYTSELYDRPPEIKQQQQQKKEKKKKKKKKEEQQQK